MDLIFRLSDPSLPPTRLHHLGTELASDLRRQHDVGATLHSDSDLSAGHKGDLLSVGNIVVQLASSAAAVALVGVLKTYFERKPTLSIEIKRPDGATLSITGDHLLAPTVGDLIDRLTRFVKG